MPPLMLTQAKGYDRIDRSDWAAAWDLMKPSWPNPQTITFSERQQFYIGVGAGRSTRSRSSVLANQTVRISWGALTNS